MPGYIEEESINLPRIDKGVKELGDLWNCNLSSPVGRSLFSPDIGSSEISFISIESSSYNATHIKGTEDKADRLHVSGEIKAGIVALLDLGIGLLYDKGNTRRFDEEEFIVTYRRETFRFKLKSSARNKINQNVLNQILSGKLKASHVVSEIVLGGEVTAKVNVSDLHTDDVTELSGKITAGIDIVVASAAVTAGAGLVAKEKIDEHKTRISMQSVPLVKSKPRTLSELVQVIHTLPDLISNEKHFSHLFPNANITGVPIKFRLVPISQFVEDFEAKKLYKQMSDDIMNKITSLLLTAKDILETDYVKTRVFQKGRHLLKILEDPKSQLSLAIKKKQQMLVKKSYEFQSEAIAILKKYSMGEASTSDILKLTEDYEKNANLLELGQDICQFVTQGNLDYQGLRLKEANERFAYFMNTESLIDWWKFGRKIKMLLYTKYEDGQGGVFFVLDRLSESLHKQGIEIALGAPSISEDFSLQLKVYDTKYSYTGLQQISFALQVISVALGNQDSPVSFRLYSVLASFSGVRLPFTEPSQFSDLANLISILEDTSSLVICETALRLREHIMKRDGEWKFVFVVDAVNSLVDGIKCFKNLKDNLDKRLNTSFIVGTFELEQFGEGPTVFAFKDGRLQGICFDKLDVLILVEGIKSNSNEFLELVSLESSAGNFSVYPERAQFVLALAELLNENAPIMPNENFTSSKDRQPLRDFMTISSAIVKNNNALIISTLAELCINNFPDSIYIFKKYSWVESSRKFAASFQCSSEICQQMIYSIKSFIKSQNPILEKIGLAMVSLRSFSESLEEYLDKVIESPFCPEQLKDKLKEAEKICENRYRYEKVISTLQDFTDEESKVETKSSEMKYFLATVRQTTDVFKIYLNREKQPEETEKNITQIIQDVMNDENCPEVLKAELNQSKSSNFDISISKALRLFECYEDEAMENKKYFHLLSLQKFLEQIIRSPQLNKKFISRFLLRYFNAIAQEDFPTPDLRINIKRYIGRGNVVLALHYISKSVRDELDLKIIQSFQQTKEILGEEFLINFIRHAEKALTLPKLWKCSKFLFLLRKGISNIKILKEFQQSYETLKDLPFVPKDILSKLYIHNSYAKAIESLGDLSQKVRWEKLDDFLQDLQRYAVKDVVPRELYYTLCESISHSPSLYESLRLSNSLFYWNEESKCFVEPWDSDTIRQAIDNIMKWTEKQNNSQPQEVKICNENNELIYQKQENGKQFTGDWSVLNGFETNVDTFKPLIPESQIKSIRNTPDNFAHLLQYTIDSLRITSKSTISQNPLELKQESGAFLFPFEKGNNHEHQSSYSYIELLSSLLYVYNDPVGLKHIFCCLSAFNKPLPVVVPYLTDFPAKFVHALQILYKLPILCSNSKNGRLFESPFRGILCLQVGSFHNRISPINILNSILKLESQFFLGDTEVSGFTELVPLNPLSCKSEFWNEKMKKWDWTPVLINVHGNCLNAPDVIKLFQSICSSTILFYPPCEVKKTKQQLTKLTPFLKSSGMHYYGVYIGPVLENAPENYSFKTTDSMINLQRKTSSLFRDILESVKKPKLLQKIDTSFENEILWPMPSLETTSSMKLVAIIQRISCRATKQLLEDLDTEAKYFKEVVSTAVNIFTSKPSILKQAIVHLEFELNILSGKEGITISSTDFLKTLNQVLKDDLKAKCFENFALYIFRYGGLFNIDTEDMRITKLIFSHLDKLISPCKFQVISVFGNDNDELMNATFNSSTMSFHNCKINDVSKVDFRVIKLNDFFLDPKDENGIKYLLIFNNQLPMMASQNEELKLATLLISMSNLVLLNADGSDVLNHLDTVLLDACRIKSDTNPDFIVITPKNSNETPQDYENKLSSAIENISKISESDYKFNLGLLYNPLDKFIKAQCCQVATLDKSDHGYDYDDIGLLRQYILDSCLELNLLYLENPNDNFSTWTSSFLENWSNLQNFSLTSEFDSYPNILKWIKKEGIIDEFKDSVDAAFHNHRQDVMEKSLPENQNNIDENILTSHLKEIIENCPSGCSECKRVVSLLDKSSQLLDVSILYAYIENVRKISFQELLQKLSVKTWKKHVKDNQKDLKTCETLRFVVPPRRRCLAEVKLQYRGGASWITQQLELKELPIWSKIDAFPKCILEQKKLTWEQEDWLEAEIEDVVKFIFIQTEENIYQMGMIRLLKKKICQILHHFQLHFEEELLLYFQWHVHVFAIKSFLSSIERKQDLWNDEYDPLTIMEKSKTK